jgi:hypothetical protein
VGDLNVQASRPSFEAVWGVTVSRTVRCETPIRPSNKLYGSPFVVT